MRKAIDGQEQIRRLAAMSRRRRAHRFEVTWPVVVSGFDQRGEAFQEFCFVKNLSSTGACLDLTRLLAIGATVKVDLCTPLSRKQCLRYSGKVIYVGHPVKLQTVGIEFDSVKPTFIPAVAAIRFRPLRSTGPVVH